MLIIPLGTTSCFANFSETFIFSEKIVVGHIVVQRHKVLSKLICKTINIQNTGVTM